MTDRDIQAPGATIATRSAGHEGDEPVLLIMGMMASMLWWPESLVTGLADQGRLVIRYDHRDTGRSTHFPRGEPGYGLDDMIGDALAVLDGYGLASAHVVGMSLGGMISQALALRHPERVRSLTLLSTSPLGAEGLPPPEAAYLEHAESAGGLDWSDEEAVADFLVRDAAHLAGTGHPHDATATRDLVARDRTRATDFTTLANHGAVAEAEPDASLRAADLRVPLLVIHGTADPLFPMVHGEAFMEAVPGARLERIEGGGHEIHAADVGRIVEAITSQTDRRD